MSASSPARARFKAARTERRHAAAQAMRAVHTAATQAASTDEKGQQA